RWSKEISFDRSSYGPGDTMEISASAVPVENSGPGGQALQARLTVSVDGQQVWIDQRNLPVEGKTRYTGIKLPGAEQMAKGEGIVSITFLEGVGVNHETIARPIPIVHGKIQVDFYP